MALECLTTIALLESVIVLPMDIVRKKQMILQNIVFIDYLKALVIMIVFEVDSQ